jgi:hypothetical protein
LLVLGITLSLPFVQTKIAHYVTERINEDYGTDIYVDKVAISVFGTVKLRDVLIKDHHKDTLVAAMSIKTNILSFKKLKTGDLVFGDLYADKLFFNLKTYKNETNSNINVFIKLFDTGKKAAKPFQLNADNIYLNASHFKVTNENLVNQTAIDFTKMNSRVRKFKIYGSDITTEIKELSMMDHRGLFIKDLNGKFSYSKESILLKELNLLTKESSLKGSVVLTYKEGGLSDFVNKVRLDVDVDSASISTNDLNIFYNEFGKNKKFNFSTIFSGTMNDFFTRNLKLVVDKKSQIIGDINFKNLFNPDKNAFMIKGNFKRLSSDYANLKTILPRILGEKLPSSLEHLGNFDLVGSAQVTKTTVKADLYLTTDIGELATVLELYDIDNIDNASYSGNINFNKFNIGKFLKQKDLGIATLDLEVKGKGFTRKFLNTKVSGTVFSLNFMNYNYKNIDIDGTFKNPIFQGKVLVNDENLKLDFKGLVDLSKRENRYDFHALIDYADLNKLQLIKRDSISLFKGDITMQVTGNSLDNMYGDIAITQTSYQNEKDTYFFDDFTVQSRFDANRIRTISIESPDIIQGKIVGKYQFKEVSKIVENAIGSLYTNYKPNKVKPGQFLDFNLSIYNKLIEIFLPEVSVGSNTVVSGKMTSDSKEFKLNFNSPEIKAYENYFDNVSLEVDNQNPLYNAYVEMDSIRTKRYKITDFSTISVKLEDTLFFRTEMKGGVDNKDFYNLNIYHTIDEKNNNVVGIKKSQVNIKDYMWFLNEQDANDNRVVFDKKLKNFSIENILMTHDNQRVELQGIIRDSTYKDVNLSFEDVSLGKLLPSMDSLRIAGNLNGRIDFKQNKNIYQPSSSIRIDSLHVNEISLGNLSVDVEGNENLNRFSVNSVLENENVENFVASGDIGILNKQTIFDLNFRFNKFNLGALSPLGGNVISKIRGFASGTAGFAGTLKDPQIDGRLFLDNVGLKVPYLNVDYEFDERSIVDLTENQFRFNDARMTDTKNGTKGFLTGSIKHQNFKNWVLDLNIKSDNLLVLDTKDSDDAIYYGTAFIAGSASLKGPTNALLITVDAESKKGTNIKIPISSASGVGNNSFITFLSPKEKYNQEKGIVVPVVNNAGLELQFNLKVTPEAEVEIIIDKNTGHALKGKGNGDIRLEISTLGKFNMFGTYDVTEGEYNFKYGGIIDKKFSVKKGSSIAWDGDPIRARLNIDAVYKTQANPAVLQDNASFNRKVPVEVVINLTGNLTNPEPDFTINFPTVSSVLKSELQVRLDDRDTRVNQALSLLGTGNFLSADNAGTAVYGSLFERASGLFNDLFQDEDGKFNVVIDYQAADRTPTAETSGQIGVVISTQLSDRISVDGKVGVPVGGMNQSVIVGNVEVKYRVNDDGTLNLRVFNRENDINYIGEGIGYTQGLGVSYEVDFDTLKELWYKIFNIQTKEEKNNASDEVPDSVFSPDFIQWTQERKKKAENPKTEQQRVPESE